MYIHSPTLADTHTQTQYYNTIHPDADGTFYDAASVANDVNISIEFIQNYSLVSFINAGGHAVDLLYTNMH